MKFFSKGYKVILLENKVEVHKNGELVEERTFTTNYSASITFHQTIKLINEDKYLGQT